MLFIGLAVIGFMAYRRKSKPALITPREQRTAAPVMAGNAFVMANSAAGAISVRPEAAGTASGAMGFLQQGIGALVSQFGAYLGGHSTTTLPLTAAVFAISILCASTMIFIVPRRTVVVSEELIEQAEVEESGMF